MVQSLLADVRREISRDERFRRMFAGSATLRSSSSRISGAAPSTPREMRSAKRAVFRCSCLDVVGRDVVERDRVDEHEPLDALGAVERQVHRDGAAEVDADDRRLGEPERRQRAVEVVGLRGDAVLCVERPVRFAVAEEVDGERRSVRHGQRRSDVAPEETARAEAVYEQNRARRRGRSARRASEPGPTGMRSRSASMIVRAESM